MKRLLFCLLFIPQIVFGQDLAELKETALQKNNAKSWNLLAKYYYDIPDTALCRISAEKAYQLAMAEKNNKEIGLALQLLASKHEYNSNLPEYIKENKEALSYLNLTTEIDLQREVLNNIGDAQNILGNYDESISILRQVITISGQHDCKDSYLAGALINTGYAFLQKAELDSCLFYVNNALDIAEIAKDTVVLIEGHNQSGIIQLRQENYNAALAHYEKSLALYEQTKDYSRMCVSLINIATLYNEWKKYDKALPFAQRAVDYAYKYNQSPQILGKCLRILGHILVFNGEHQAGLDSIKSSLPHLPQNIYDEIITNIYLTKAYELVNKKDSASFHLKKAEKILNDNPHIPKSSFLLLKGSYLVRNEAYTEAVAPLEEYAELQKNATRRSLADIYEAYNSLSQAYELGPRNYEKALLYKNLAYNKRDSILNDEHNEKLSEYYAQFQTAEKELVIARLNEEKQTILFNRTLIIGGLIILSIVLFTAWLYSRLRMLRKVKESEFSEMRHYLDGLETERNRLAKDLHDIVANRLFVLELTLKEIEHVPDTIPAQVEELYTLTRSISHDLISPSFQQLTLPEILFNHIGETKERTPVQISLSIDNEPAFAYLPAEVSHEVYRIAQECIGNAIKHAKAEHIQVSLAIEEDTVRLLIKDNGTGFDPEKQTKGIGLKVIHDRVKSLNGNLSIRTAKGEGTEMEIEIKI